MSLLEAQGQAIVLFDDERRYVAANSTACRLLGRSLDVITRLRVDDVTLFNEHGEVPDADQRWREFLDRGSDAGQCTLDAEGGNVVVDFYARAHFASGLHLSIFTPATDATSDGDGRRSDARRGTLTQRERDVLTLVAAGLTGVEIADRLSISPPTVESHVGNAMRKLGATNRAHAIALAMDSSLIAL